MMPEASAIPYFARKYDVGCTQCHSLPPMLNEFGQRFVSNGYKSPELATAQKTIPVAVWMTLRTEVDETGDRAKAYPSRPWWKWHF